MSVTVSEALSGAKVEGLAPLDAELLLSHVLGVRRSRLLLLGDTRLSDCQYELYKTYTARRASGICLAYIIEHKEFRYLDLYVNSDVLVPRPDTETLVEAALELIAKKSDKPVVLDLCTGSGAIALALAQEVPNLEVYASDISAPALSVARKNAETMEAETDHSRVHFIESDLFDNIEGRFDIIVSNPPYVRHDEMAMLPPEVQNEPRLALDGGEDGLVLVKKIIPQAREHLKEGGALLLEADPRQMDAIRQLLQDAGYQNIFTREDLAGDKRVICGSIIGVR
jgi:release factor glutamine methyltransferase